MDECYTARNTRTECQEKDRKFVRLGKKLLNLIYKVVEKILQLPEVTSVTAEYAELIKIIDF